MKIFVATVLSIALLLGNSVKLRASVTGPVASDGDGPASQTCACQTCCQGTAAIPGVPGQHGFPGSKGDAGQPGQNGDIGPIGPMGERGASGDAGPKGYDGRPGKIGPRGLPGLVGTTGQTGVKGQNGDIGPIGPMGERGASGDAGPKGDDGIGQRGDIGPRGLPGVVGNPGQIGVKGQNGEIGPIGPMGERGASGNVGPKGDDGIGQRGKIGPRGPPGVVGRPGQTGVKGQKGEPGETPDDSNQRVAFTAVRTSHSDISTSHNTRLPFQQTETLLSGTSFDLGTGTFTCTVPGTYVFTFSVCKYSSSSALFVHLRKNGAVVVSGYSNDSSHNEQMSGSAVLVLQRGDTVWLTYAYGRAYSSSGHTTSFSGFLLYS